MSASRCPRMFEAEALRDGRLDGAGRASFERHIATCSACAHEVEALDALASALRASFPGPADELHARRQRTRLLAAFDRELVTPERAPIARRGLLWSAAAVALACAALVVWRVQSGSDAAHAVEPPHAVIHADSATAWSDRMENKREVVTLEHGALWIHVEHRPGTRRLLVVLPDGELEDTGTTFSISADGGHTTRVAVRQGSVVLRLRGQPTVALGPGDVWTPSPASSCASAAPSGKAVPAQASSGEVARRRAPVNKAAPTAPRASGAVVDPSAGFREATAALNRGDNRQAAAGFARFLEAHPGNPQAEDAAYLRVIALQRCGDRAAMRAAALEYLRRYPDGFRRAEVRALLSARAKRTRSQPTGSPASP